MKTKLSKEEPLDVRTWLEIDRGAVRKNHKTFRKIVGAKTKLMSVVKSNAYGHDLVPFSKEVESAGADWLGVDSCVEGITLRKAGVKIPILVLGFVLPALLPEAARRKISVTVSSFDSLKYVALLKKPMNVHLKIDTGMHRQGFFVHEIPKVLTLLKKMPHVKVEGVYTHFAEGKNPNSPESVVAQTQQFEKAITLVEEAGHRPVRHSSATASTMLFSKFHYDMVRVGIGSYGLWPSPETRVARQKQRELTPVLSWKSIVSEIKKVPKGEGVSYDFTEILLRDTLIAIVPIGYWHGYPRALSSVGHVLVRGERARVLGRVCMDMILIDVTDIPKVKIMDTVTLLGRDGKEEVPASELAQLSNTSVYEFVTRINPKIRRVYK